MKFLIVIFCVIVAIYGHKQNMYSHGRCPEFLVIEDSNYVNEIGAYVNNTPSVSLDLTDALQCHWNQKIKHSGYFIRHHIFWSFRKWSKCLSPWRSTVQNSRDIRATYLVGETQVIKHYFINKLDNNYAMIGSCMEEGSYHIFEMWAVARDCLSCLNVQNGVQKEFEINRFSFNFTRVDHSNCP